MWTEDLDAFLEVLDEVEQKEEEDRMAEPNRKANKGKKR